MSLWDDAPADVAGDPDAGGEAADLAVMTEEVEPVD